MYIDINLKERKMPYDYEEETGTTEQIKYGERIVTDSNRYGIFERADVLDISKERVESKLNEYDQIYTNFVDQMGFTKYENDAVYYHRNIEGIPAKLDMAVTTLFKNPVSSDLYFILDYNKALQHDIPLLMVRLDDRLGTEGSSDRLTVWGYDSGSKRFTDAREVKSVEDNRRIYKNLISYLNGTDASKDAFFKIASSVYTF
ncbi:MAG: hypothetical protein RBR78_11655 [Flavobacteriaceae bacterium]|jgi:hypothetical protein|nr:hypothetical protein [Flavobacteriaceae bacterium]